MFPSPCGEMVNESSNNPSWRDGSYTFPSPCGEMVNERSVQVDIDLPEITVSVPLRGNGQWKFCPWHYCSFIGWFPSPCGEMVNERLRKMFKLFVAPLRFPSPCGEMVNESRGKDYNRSRNSNNTFPSPCGEMVNESNHEVLPYWGLLVSVPLRGNGQWKAPSIIPIWNWDWRFPSPCGEMVNESENPLVIAATVKGFRPLAGKWSMKAWEGYSQRWCWCRRFRPLAGKWSMKA